MKKIISWMRAMSVEGIVFLAVFFLRPLGYLLFHRKCSGASQGKPILLVHGYCHDCSAWFYFRKKLGKAGFGPIYVLNLNHPFRSIERYAEKVAEKAEQIEQETKQKELFLIGHSMGGLICSWYGIHAPEKVRDIVTIGAPLRGTRVARIGFGPNARQMQYNSEFVRTLQAEIEKSPVRFYQVGTKTDQLVIPSSSAFLGDHSERQLLVDGIGHLSLLFSSQVANKVCSWLKESKPLPQQSKSVPIDRVG